ncbi:MAG: hypothetical protein HY742_08110 [Deltaproteobacteria bacterium]|nr:hypothetical protein [Deltaproteobacteria bacterium]
MSKFITKIGMPMLAVLLLAGNLWAATLTASPVVYNVTVSQVRVYNSDLSTWYVAGSGDLTFDIASVTAGSVVANYVSGANLSEGTYTQVEVTLSRTMSVKAQVTDAGGVFGGGAGVTYYTTSTTTSGAVSCSTAAGSYNTGSTRIPDAVASSLPATETLSGNYLIHLDTLPNIIVKKGGTKSVKVNFNTTNVVTFENVGVGTVICYPGPPTVTITQ